MDEISLFISSISSNLNNFSVTQMISTEQTWHASILVSSRYENFNTAATRHDEVWDQIEQVVSGAVPVGDLGVRHAMVWGSVENASWCLFHCGAHIGVTVKKVLNDYIIVSDKMKYDNDNLDREVHGAGHLDPRVVLVLLNLGAEVLTSVDQSELCATTNWPIRTHHQSVGEVCPHDRPPITAPVCVVLLNVVLILICCVQDNNLIQ